MDKELVLIIILVIMFTNSPKNSDVLNALEEGRFKEIRIYSADYLYFNDHVYTDEYYSNDLCKANIGYIQSATDTEDLTTIFISKIPFEQKVYSISEYMLNYQNRLVNAVFNPKITSIKIYEDEYMYDDEEKVIKLKKIAPNKDELTGLIYIGRGKYKDREGLVPTKVYINNKPALIESPYKGKDDDEEKQEEKESLHETLDKQEEERVVEIDKVPELKKQKVSVVMGESEFSYTYDENNNEKTYQFIINKT